MILCRRVVAFQRFIFLFRKEKREDEKKERKRSNRPGSLLQTYYRSKLALFTDEFKKRSNLNAQILLCTVKSDTRFPSPVKTNGVRNNLHEERHIFLRQGGGGGAHVFSQGRKRRSYAFEATRVIKKKKRKEKEKERNGAKAKSAVPV